MRCGVVLGTLLSLTMMSTAQAESIVAATYEAPVERYGHFALGRPHEYARVLAQTDAGRTVALELPDHEVFEDLATRLVRLTEDGTTLLLTIVSSRGAGARLALLGLRGVLRAYRLVETGRCELEAPITGPDALRDCEAQLTRAP
jgi:hypothetical protein